MQLSSAESWIQSSRSSEKWSMRLSQPLDIRSISFLVAFRFLGSNELTELPPGIFDPLASLTFLYALSRVAEAPFASSILEPDIFFFFVRLSPARCSRIEPLLYGWAWPILLHLATQLSSVESWSQSSSGGDEWDMRFWQPWIMVEFISCCCGIFQAKCNSVFSIQLWFLFILVSKHKRKTTASKA